MATCATQSGANQAEDLDSTLKNLNLSNEEVDKFQKAFKDPEFLKLFGEYAKEVSDPKVKEETDLYLRQLESEGRSEEVYGKGTLLVVPTEAFVVRTQDTSTKQKVFINVCTSDKLDKLSMQPSKGPDGRVGRHVEIPLSLSAQKEGQDKAGKPCMVWDFVVHPETVAMAQRNSAIKSLLIETAVEQILKAHKVQLAADYKIVKLKYKATPAAPKPHVLAVRGGSAAGSGAAGSRVQPLPNAPAVAGLNTQPAPLTGGGAQATAAGQLQKPSSSTAGAGGRSAFKFPTCKSKQSTTKLEPNQAGYKHESGEETPTWELVHRGQVDLGECWGDSGRQLAAAPSTYPQELVLRVQLPGCTSAAGLQLDVSQHTISIIVPGRFKLEAALPFPVNDKDGKAKYDKMKQQLEVVLPTLPPARTSAALLPASIEEVNVSGETEPQQDPVQQQEQEQAAAMGSYDSKSAMVELHQAEEAAESSHDGGSVVMPQAGCSAAAEGIGAALLTDNQRRWAELHAGGHEEHTHEAGEHITSEGESPLDSAATAVDAALDSRVQGSAAHAGPTHQQEQEQASCAVPNTWLAPRLCNTLTEELD